MKCIDEKCNHRKSCEKVHLLNGFNLNENNNIVIPNQFFFELNCSNRLAKRGVPSEGFTFGCFSMKENNGQVEGGSLYINGNHITDFELSELIEMSNNAFSEMIENGEIRIG